MFSLRMRGKMKGILGLGGSLFLLLFLIQTSQVLPRKKDSVATLASTICAGSTRGLLGQGQGQLLISGTEEVMPNR